MFKFLRSLFRRYIVYPFRFMLYHVRAKLHWLLSWIYLSWAYKQVGVDFGQHYTIMRVMLTPMAYNPFHFVVKTALPMSLVLAMPYKAYVKHKAGGKFTESDYNAMDANTVNEFYEYVLGVNNG